jgi:hypothetical protein
MHYSDRLFVLSAYFPLGPTDVVRSVRITFQFEATFTKIKRSFKSWIDVHPRAYTPVCRVDLLGSLSFTQDRPLNSNRFTDVPLSEEYLEFLRDKAFALNASHPVASGETFFVPRDEIWTQGKCKMFEVEIRMRIPLLRVVVARSGIDSFLDGWTAYIAIAVPLMMLAWMALGAVYKSGFVPVHELAEAEPNKETIPKFNR